ncbi:hypothetical protein HDU67_001234 [Dinochytrium kinnereticum]|nr:hypothetical protein HDU67_001234 [Dinochytrium kinnereticum]
MASQRDMDAKSITTAETRQICPEAPTTSPLPPIQLKSFTVSNPIATKSHQPSHVISGDVWVQNIAYNKLVTVHASTADGVFPATMSIPARYREPAGERFEVWEFSGSMEGIEEGSKMYLKYETNGNVFYDNNGGDGINYTIPIPPATTKAIMESVVPDAKNDHAGESMLMQSAQPKHDSLLAEEPYISIASVTENTSNTASEVSNELKEIGMKVPEEEDEDDQIDDGLDSTNGNGNGNGSTYTKVFDGEKTNDSSQVEPGLNGKEAATIIEELPLTPAPTPTSLPSTSLPRGEYGPSIVEKNDTALLGKIPRTASSTPLSFASSVSEGNLFVELNKDDKPDVALVSKIVEEAEKNETSSSKPKKKESSKKT